jgi:MFS family permease
MKTGKWIIIVVITFTVAVALCYSLFYHSLAEAIAVAALNGLGLMSAAAVGYGMVYAIEKNDLYNTMVAIFMPWLPIGALTMAALLVFPILGYVIEALFAFLLIASSLGGFIAHKKRSKLFAKNEK